MTKVDILLPIHGHAPFLAETMNSIFANNVVRTHLFLILDRCLRTDIESLTENAPDNFVITIVYCHEPGIVSALNLGLSLGNSPLIARIDSDDLMAPDRVQVQLDFLEENNHVICVGSQLEFIDEEGRTIGNTNYPLIHNQILNRMNFQNSMAHPSVMFRRLAFDEIEGYRTEFTGAEDYELWTRMIEIGQFQNYDRTLTKYRYSQSQYSKTLKEIQTSVENNIRICKYLRKISDLNEFPTCPASREVVDQVQFHKFWMMKFKAEKPEVYRKLRSVECMNNAWKIWGIKPRDFPVFFGVLRNCIESLYRSPISALTFILFHYRFHSSRG